MSYLGINHHRLGPPPNWRDYKKGLFGLRFDKQAYIRDVELYMRLTHLWHFHIDITDYDLQGEVIGEDALSIERILKNALKMIETHARRWDSVRTPDEIATKNEDIELRWQNALDKDGIGRTCMEVVDLESGTVTKKERFYEK